MPLAITATLSFVAPHPVDCLLQCEVAGTPQQRIVNGVTTLPAAMPVQRVAAQDGVGERFWITAEGEVSILYEATVEIARRPAELSSLGQVAKTALPGDTTQYLFDSRYCAAETFQSLVEDEFHSLHGGARVEAMRDWIAQHFTYAPGTSGSHTTARDSFVERRGVCRDYAHVMIAFARASGIPARYASCYAPEVTPQDFHAVAEVFLDDGTGGDWVLVDPTGMAEPHETAVIGVGRDAADVSFLTSFGLVDFGGHAVSVERY
ncbi:transglutaminase-like domain-containing protein [Parerythrobacter aestuarii]|uniref:transglutaminase-like domain-containing protein n=1 Tax=Parerythrobacter aestuarii TaxID=3020909 RepID=UPI0024DE38E4|nr:transglutaminase family protein [Parerythrobacter aestuarii]